VAAQNHNEPCNRLRRQSRRNEVELDDTSLSFLSGSDINYERTEIRQQVYAALAQLSPEHRAVIVLKHIEDLQYQEIAEILNLSIGTVMSRLFYGRKAFPLESLKTGSCDGRRSFPSATFQKNTFLSLAFHSKSQ
jgi:RNA polymerase sigma factor (sigma-70 family)